MICGLLGEKLSHSYSPQIHQNLADYSYELFEKSPEELGGFLTQGNFQGLNVTVPYKKAVLPYCSELTPQAKALGAVNTIIRLKDGTLLGHNTDYFGFRSMAQRDGIAYDGKKVLVLGSGGASNTVCAVMKELGADVVVISRTGGDNYKNLHNHSDCAVIINTTPVGMYPNTGVSPLSLDHFPKLEYVMDVIYNPGKTQLILDAEARGVPAQNGLWMLVAQAAESAHWFGGIPVDYQCIETIYQKLRKQMGNIVLVGMPGSGKTTIGRILAKRLNKQFLDSDHEIESLAGCSIPEIFQDYGEPEFRRQETSALAKICKLSSCVIATGGGCVTQAENRSILRQNGVVIWIQRNTNDLCTEGRPLSQKSSLAQMYQFRQPLYRSFADFSIENRTTPEAAAEEIIKRLENTL